MVLNAPSQHQPQTRNPPPPEKNINFVKARGSKSDVLIWGNISKHERQCFIGIPKHREDSWKYYAQRIILDEIQGV